MKEQPRTDRSARTVSVQLPGSEELLWAGGKNSGEMSSSFLLQQQTECESEKHYSLQASVELYFMTSHSHSVCQCFPQIHSGGLLSIHAAKPLISPDRK